MLHHLLKNDSRKFFFQNSSLSSSVEWSTTGGGNGTLRGRPAEVLLLGTRMGSSGEQQEPRFINLHSGFFKVSISMELTLMLSEYLKTPLGRINR